MMESMDTVANFLPSFENPMSTIPVADPLHDIVGYLEKGQNLLGLQIKYAVPQEHGVIETAHCEVFG